jgi:hypothetical protein
MVVIWVLSGRLKTSGAVTDTIIVQFEGDGMAGLLRHIEGVRVGAPALIGAVR